MTTRARENFLARIGCRVDDCMAGVQNTTTSNLASSLQRRLPGWCRSVGPPLVHKVSPCWDLGTTRVRAISHDSPNDADDPDLGDRARSPGTGPGGFGRRCSVRSDESGPAESVPRPIWSAASAVGARSIAFARLPVVGRSLDSRSRVISRSGSFGVGGAVVASRAILDQSITCSPNRTNLVRSGSFPRSLP